MATKFQAGRARWKAFMARRSRIGRLSIRMLVLFTLAIILYNAHTFRVLDVIFIIISSAILLPLLPILAYRWITRRVLWKVRNRLILTYLLMGLSPIVLFGTLGGIATYLFIGQYATNTALTILDDRSMKLKDQTADEAGFALSQQPPHSTPVPAVHGGPFAGSPATVFLDEDNHWRTLISPTPDSAAQETPDPLLLPGEAAPAWLKPKPPSHGIVAARGHLYLWSESLVQHGNNTVLVVGSMPITAKELDKMAKDLGTITLMPGFSRLRNDEKDADVEKQVDDLEKDDDTPPVPAKPGQPKVKSPAKPKISVQQNGDQYGQDRDFSKVTGGKLPLAKHFYDAPVIFSLPISITSWQTGDTEPMLVLVESRPTLLYAHLFSTAVGVGTFVRVALVIITTVFVIIEILALLMALSLSRTITRSVADLYRGTKEIDAGHLEHRIRVAKYDQLGALASSFNGMADSISQLLIQQREKERLLNELKIAQEVQTTLFPESPATLGGFEMHAMSVPARTVGGDYFDFIFGPGNNLCLALGDISGKGISAALLMASLNSAVRAFILGHDAAESSTPSPAMLLTLLNRHLYLSTQSTRYATLFLATYNVETRTLTYANGGHLPPVVLSTDGTIRRLDVGGSVVGLLEDLEYLEATVQLEPGDLLVAFTDGLTEPENVATEEFGETRLFDYITYYRQLALPVLAAATLKTLQEWIGEGEQPDDMTILLARQL
jgi:sigma-B regulation protein RsbU (phosphoserine phosphatase)